MVGIIVNQVLLVSSIFVKLADFRVLYGLFLILFVMDKCVLLLLFHVIYVVVVPLVIMVTS